MADEPVKIDLTHAFNRLVDTWYDLFNGDVQSHMPGYACAFPGNFDEALIDRVKNEASSQSYSLRWHQEAKATDSNWELRRLFSKIAWEVKVAWEGFAFTQEDTTYYLIDNALAYVELKEPSQSLSLNVQGSFGHPSFHGNIARLPVWFRIVVHDGSTTIRDEHRGFDFYGDGSREQLPS